MKFSSHLYLSLLIALPFFLPMPVFAQEDQTPEWSETLQQALDLDHQGRTFEAYHQLSQLHQQYPNARLKLELAVLASKLNRLVEAITLVEQVLGESDLPVKVRINAQLFLSQLKEQQSDPAKNKFLARVSIEGGFEPAYDSYWTGYSLTALYATPGKLININGYPYASIWQYSVTGLSRFYVQQDYQPYSSAFQASFKLAGQKTRSDLGGGYLSENAGNGLFAFTSVSYSPKNTYTTRVSLRQQWLTNANELNYGWYNRFYVTPSFFLDWDIAGSESTAIPGTEAMWQVWSATYRHNGLDLGIDYQTFPWSNDPTELTTHLYLPLSDHWRLRMQAETDPNDSNAPITWKAGLTWKN